MAVLQNSLTIIENYLIPVPFTVLFSSPVNSPFTELNMTVGYARVSTPEQKLEAQIALLKKEGCEKIYIDIASGTRDERKGLNEMLKYMRIYKTKKPSCEGLFW